MIISIVKEHLSQLPKELNFNDKKINLVVLLFQDIDDRKLREREVSKYLNVDELELHNAFYHYKNNQWDEGDEIINNWKIKCL